MSRMFKIILGLAVSQALVIFAVIEYSVLHESRIAWLALAWAIVILLSLFGLSRREP
jgi:peptidoglycan biosynthesis protein MviN/MurJ (putative lipid II flippase)